MNKTEIAQQIKETEEKLAALRLELEKPEYPTLEDSKPGDKLDNGCIVVHKFEETRMSLIAAPESTEIRSHWSKDFIDVFNKLEQEGFNRSQWFIPNVEQLKMVYDNCKEHFKTFYWTSVEHSNDKSAAKEVSFKSVTSGYNWKGSENYVRAFSLVSY